MQFFENSHQNFGGLQLSLIYLNKLINNKYELFLLLNLKLLFYNLCFRYFICLKHLRLYLIN